MPGFPDKIIINSGNNGGVSGLVANDLYTLGKLGEELIAMDKAGTLKLSATLDLRDMMKVACAKHEVAQMEYHQTCRKLIEETAARIDKAHGL